METVKQTEYLYMDELTLIGRNRSVFKAIREMVVGNIIVFNPLQRQVSILQLAGISY